MLGHQGRRGLLGQPGLHDFLEIAKCLAALQGTGLHGREDPLQKSQPPPRSGEERELAFDHEAAQRPLGRIVGRRHRRIPEEVPQGRLDLEQVGAGVGRA